MYLEFYGLTAEPFLLTPDHRFYFESRVHAQAMSHLLYGVSRGEGFIVITGEVGTGKTTILHRLCETIDKEKVVAANIVTTLLSGTELLRTVCAAFKLSDVPQNKDGVLLQLREYFESLHASGRRALLIVDEAQNLSAIAIEELRMLSNYQVGSHSLCQMFLIGQPQFRSNLIHPNLAQFRQRVIATYHLGPMSEEECGQYLFHRLKHVGWQNDPSFEDNAIREIALQTGGVPRQINTYCSRLLLLGFLDEIHRFSAQDVRRVAGDMQAEYGNGRIESQTGVNGDGEIYLDKMDHAENRTVRDRFELMERRIDRHDESLKKIAMVLSRIFGSGGQIRNRR